MLRPFTIEAAFFIFRRAHRKSFPRDLDHFEADPGCEFLNKVAGGDFTAFFNFAEVVECDRLEGEGGEVEVLRRLRGDWKRLGFALY